MKKCQLKVDRVGMQDLANILAVMGSSTFLTKEDNNCRQNGSNLSNDARDYEDQAEEKFSPEVGLREENISKRLHLKWLSINLSGN